MQPKNLYKAKLISLDGKEEIIPVPGTEENGLLYTPKDIEVDGKLYVLSKKPPIDCVEYNEVERPNAKVIPFRKDLH